MTIRIHLVCLIGISAAFAPAVCQAQAYTINTAAGGANPYFLPGTGDGGPATSAGLASLCYDVALDGAGNLYIVAGSLIRKVNRSGIISTFAGGGTSIQDGVPATQEELAPIAIASDAAGDLYIADTAFGTSRIRKVDTSGTITTVAGGAPCCTLGDGGPATSAYVGIPYGVAIDPAGNLYIAQADSQNNRIRKVAAKSGSISTVAGGGSGSGDGGQATAIALARPTGVAIDAAGNIYIAEAGGNRIRKVTSAGVISTVAGDGAATTSGDGGPATAAGVDSPWHVAVDAAGKIYITQINDAIVRLAIPGGTIATIAGTGVHGFSGDGGPATTASMDRPAGIAVSGTGEVYIADATSGIARVRILTSPLQLVPIAPCRIMDTRSGNGPLGGPFIAANTTRTIPILASACNIPGNAVAYSLNVTVVPRTGTLGYLSVWPAGQAQPVVSTLNSPEGLVLANAAIVPAGSSGSINAFATDDTDLVVDINGAFVPPATSTLQFYALPPCRVLDTRNLNDTFGGPSIPGGSSRSFPIPSSPCGTPANAAAYSFNVTVVPRGQLGFLTVWPTGQAQPLASTLNSLDGTILANAAIVPAGASGAVSFYASDTTDVIVDIDGYFAPPTTGGLNFYTATPCRLVDTRNATGTFGGPTLSTDSTRAFPLSQGSCELPSYPAAQAYSLNVTVVPQGILGFLTTWPTGGTQPGVSTLNALKGQVVANAAIVPASTSGSVSVFVTNPADVIIDTNGYFGE